MQIFNTHYIKFKGLGMDVGPGKDRHREKEYTTLLRIYIMLLELNLIFNIASKF